MTVSEMAKQIKNIPGCAEAIEGTRGSHVGTVVQAEPDTLAGLRLAGVIGEKDGLTVKGSALAARMQSEYLDRMFG
jgi:hypothetical protein